MMSMQVPEGEQYAGMVHHKIHDFGWTGLPLMPADDDNMRYLHRPSTAATLNLAATAAQGARLFKKFDRDYAEKLLDGGDDRVGGRDRDPDLYAPVADGPAGGGPYDDDDVTDEFYWAAAELYLTTGESEYEDYLLASPIEATTLHRRCRLRLGPHRHARAAWILPPSRATFPEREAIQASVIAGADALLAVQAEQGFGQALGGGRLRVGIQRGDAQQHGDPRDRVRHHGRRRVPRRGAREHGLSARAQRAEPVLHHRIRHRVLAEPALPLVRRAARPVLPAPPGRRGRRGAERRAGSWDP